MDKSFHPLFLCASSRVNEDLRIKRKLTKYSSEFKIFHFVVFCPLKIPTRYYSDPFFLLNLYPLKSSIYLSM